MFDEYQLSLKERCSLWKLKCKKKLRKENIKSFDSLYNHRFISPIAGEPDGYGGFYESGYYELSKAYKTWFHAKTEHFINNRLPIIISILSLIVSIFALLKP